MIQCGKSFAQALREAQQKGYAEADPTADVEGIDAGARSAYSQTSASARTSRPRP